MQAPAQPPPNPTQPPLAVAIPPQPSLQDMLGDTQESNPLADIADIKDILTSAFDEDEGLDPDRAALGRSLDEVDIKELVRLTHQITDTLKQEPLDEPLLVQLEG